MKEFFKIVGMCIVAAILYGIIHDQITARICVEYFTIGHVPIGTNSPTLLGFAWGVIATWWFGLFLGVLLALAARVGTLPKLTTQDLRIPVTRLMLTCFVLAFLSGLVGYTLAQQKVIWLTPYLAEQVPSYTHSRFLTDLWIHTASYLCGGIGASILCGWVITQRVLRDHASRKTSR